MWIRNLQQVAARFILLFSIGSATWNADPMSISRRLLSTRTTPRGCLSRSFSSGICCDQVVEGARRWFPCTQRSTGMLRLKGGVDIYPAFGEESLSHGSSEVEILQQFAEGANQGNRTWRRAQLERIQKGLFRKIQGTPGLGPPPPHLFPDLEIEAEGNSDIPYGVSGPRRTWKDIRGEETQLRDGDKIRENLTLSEHAHPYHYKTEYDETPPGNTLYIRNLRERVGPARMRQLLYAVFSKFGTLLDVVMLRTKKMRGQAFVCFQELSHAVRAKEELDGFSFLNRTLVIQFARTQSHALHVVRGSFTRMVEQRRTELLQDRAQHEQTQVVQQEEELQEMAQTVLKASSTDANNAVAALHAMGVHRTEKRTEILLIESVPEGIFEQDVIDVFGQFDGFIKLAAVPNVGGTFIAEYQSKSTASDSQDALDGFTYPEFPELQLRVSFVRAADVGDMWNALSRTPGTL